METLSFMEELPLGLIEPQEILVRRLCGDTLSFLFSSDPTEKEIIRRLYDDAKDEFPSNYAIHLEHVQENLWMAILDPQCLVCGVLHRQLDDIYDINHELYPDAGAVYVGCTPNQRYTYSSAHILFTQSKTLSNIDANQWTELCDFVNRYLELHPRPIGIGCFVRVATMEYDDTLSWNPKWPSFEVALCYHGNSQWVPYFFEGDYNIHSLLDSTCNINLRNDTDFAEAMNQWNNDLQSKSRPM
jgi:hypothetical protein